MVVRKKVKELGCSVECADALTLIGKQDGVNLWLTDPPYYGVVGEKWDNQWKSLSEFVDWWVKHAEAMFDRTANNGSLVFFCGVGPNSQHAADLLIAMRRTRWTFRNWVTWSKRRGYGKEFDYLNAREEILWYSKSKERTEVVFNKPFTSEVSDFKTTMGGKDNPNEFKRVTTVWKDLPEKLSAKESGHICEKPQNVMRRLVETHSNPGDLIVDPFAGSGATGQAAVELGRRAVLGDADTQWASYCLSQAKNWTYGSK